MTDHYTHRSYTGDLNDALGHIDDIKDLKRRYLTGMQEDSAAWQEKIRTIMADREYSQNRMAELCGVSKTAVGKWLGGAVPGRRETFLRIGFAAGYGLEEMDRLLQRYGKYNGLYAKSLEDSVCIFVLNARTLDHTYAVYEETLKAVEERLKVPAGPEEAYRETGLLKAELLRLETVGELEAFLQENAAAFRSAFSLFYARVEALIRANNWEYRGAGDTGTMDTGVQAEKDRFNVKNLADAQDWSASLRRCVSAIRQRKWVPMRKKVLSLGLHMNVDRRGMDELLTLAHMEPLCAKNPLESAIIFAMEEADLLELIPDPRFPDASMDLCAYVEKTLKYLDLPDTEDFLADIHADL